MKMFTAKPPMKKGAVTTSMSFEIPKAGAQYAPTRGTVTGGYPLSVRGGNGGGSIKKSSKRKSKPMY
jgi:hypothetical protein